MKTLCTETAAASSVTSSSNTSSIASSVLRPITALSSSLLSWVLQTGSCSTSLLPSAAPHLPWLALMVLKIDTRREDECGLWRALLKRLYQSPDEGMEAALKVSCSTLVGGTGDQSPDEGMEAALKVSCSTRVGGAGDQSPDEGI